MRSIPSSLPVRTLVPAVVAALVGACGDPAADLRADRLGRLVAETEAAEARAEAFGHGLEVLRALRNGLQGIGGRAWVPTEDGGLNVLTLRAYHQWNSTAEGRERPRAVDYGDPEHPIHEIVARAESLREKGVDYLLVLVPTRFEIYPELLVPTLAGEPDFGGLNPGTIAFQAELARRGVETVPLLGPFADHRLGPSGGRWLHLRAQPLWSPAGVALAAREIADAVRRFPWFEQGPALEGIEFEVDTRAMTVTLPLPAELEGLPSLAEPEVLPIEAVLTRDGLAAHVPDRESPIVLIGDSAISLYEQLGGDLAGQLYRLLGIRLDVVSAPAGDAWMTFERRADPLAGKQLVIEVQSSGFRLAPTPHAPLSSE